MEAVLRLVPLERMPERKARLQPLELRVLYLNAVRQELLVASAPFAVLSTWRKDRQNQLELYLFIILLHYYLTQRRPKV